MVRLFYKQIMLQLSSLFTAFCLALDLLCLQPHTYPAHLSKGDRGRDHMNLCGTKGLRCGMLVITPQACPQIPLSQCRPCRITPHLLHSDLLDGDLCCRFWRCASVKEYLCICFSPLLHTLWGLQFAKWPYGNTKLIIKYFLLQGSFFHFLKWCVHRMWSIAYRPIFDDQNKCTLYELKIRVCFLNFK